MAYQKYFCKQITVILLPIFSHLYDYLNWLIILQSLTLESIHAVHTFSKLWKTVWGQLFQAF